MRLRALYEPDLLHFTLLSRSPVCPDHSNRNENSQPSPLSNQSQLLARAIKREGPNGIGLILLATSISRMLVERIDETRFRAAPRGSDW